MGVTQADIQCWGGGADGDNYFSVVGSGAGGGAGAFAGKALTKIGATDQLVVGWGSANGFDGSGGPSWFRDPGVVNAAGGGPAFRGSTSGPSIPGDGGPAFLCAGDVIHAGGNGGTGGNAVAGTGSGGGGGAGGSTADGGTGGNSSGANGGAAGAGGSIGGGDGAAGRTNIGANLSGLDGAFPGGGGGGGITAVPNFSAFGHGAAGLVTVCYYTVEESSSSSKSSSSISSASSSSTSSQSSAAGEICFSLTTPSAANDASFVPALSNYTTGSLLNNLGRDSSNRENGRWDRFTNVMLDRGTTITSATYRMWCGGGINGPVLLKAHCELSPDSVMPANFADFNSRAMTTAVKTFSITTPLPSQRYIDVDVKNLVQEVINLGGWTFGSALSVVIRDNAGSTNSFVTTYFNESIFLGGQPAKLNICYLEESSSASSSSSSSASSSSSFLFEFVGADNSGRGFTATSAEQVASASSTSLGFSGFN